MTICNNIEQRICSSLDTLQALLHQEQTFYHLPPKEANYLQTIPSSANNKPVDEECRYKMACWCYGIASLCAFQSETVGIAMSILDKFLATAGASYILLDRNRFQLSVMASLYTAAKLHESEALSPKQMALVSKGRFTTAHITAMELEILMAIHWHVHPPTAHNFLTPLLHQLLPTFSVTKEQHLQIMHLATVQIDLAVRDYELFTGENQSSLAVASLATALETVVVSDHDNGKGGIYYRIIWKKALKNSLNTNVDNIQRRLLELLSSEEEDDDDQDQDQEQEQEQEQEQAESPMDGAVHLSPRSVSDFG
jgi:hypothetical protein